MRPAFPVAGSLLIPDLGRRLPPRAGRETENLAPKAAIDSLLGLSVGLRDDPNGLLALGNRGSGRPQPR